MSERARPRAFSDQIALAVGSLDGETQKLLREFGRFVCRHWREPDHGIWEPRGLPEHRTHSRLLCWVALDRLVRLAEAGLLDRVDRARLASECATIRTDIEAHAFDPARGCYTGAFGHPALDASVLLMTLYGPRRTTARGGSRPGSRPERAAPERGRRSRLERGRGCGRAAARWHQLVQRRRGPPVVGRSGQAPAVAPFADRSGDRLGARRRREGVEAGRVLVWSLRIRTRC